METKLTKDEYVKSLENLDGILSVESASQIEYISQNSEDYIFATKNKSDNKLSFYSKSIDYCDELGEYPYEDFEKIGKEISFEAHIKEVIFPDFKLDNKDILRLYRQSEYNQIDEKGVHYELFTSYKGKTINDDYDVVMGEIFHDIKEGTFKGIDMNVYATAYIAECEIPLVANKINDDYFNQLLPANIQKDIEKSNSNNELRKLVLKIRAKDSYVDHEILNANKHHIVIRTNGGWYQYDKDRKYNRISDTAAKSFFYHQSSLERFKEMQEKTPIIIQLSPEHKKVIVQHIVQNIKDFENISDEEELDLISNIRETLEMPTILSDAIENLYAKIVDEMSDSRVALEYANTLDENGNEISQNQETKIKNL